MEINCGSGINSSYILMTVDYSYIKKTMTKFMRVILFTGKHLAVDFENNSNNRKRCKICSKLTIKTPERLHWRRSGVFIVNFEHISHLILVFLLLNLNR